jgi:hypothetical protein
MLRYVAVVMLSLIATLTVAKAEDHADLRASLQGCLDGALTAGNFGKARMGTGGCLSCTVPTRPRNRCIPR